jgi:hypothetical protein
MYLSKSLSVGALMLISTLGMAQAAPMAPANAGQAAKVEAASGVEQVHYRGRRGGFGRGLAIGLGAAIVGGIVANEIYRPRPGYYYDDYVYDGPYYYPSRYSGDPRVLCAQNFRSFEWNTGLYTTYSGDKRVCPYLR